MKFEDNYVVRIYRREPSAGAGRRAHDRAALAGIVEHPGTGAHTVFHDVEELWAALVQLDTGADKPQRR